MSACGSLVLIAGVCAGGPLGYAAGQGIKDYIGGNSGRFPYALTAGLILGAASSARIGSGLGLIPGGVLGASWALPGAPSAPFHAGSWTGLCDNYFKRSTVFGSAGLGWLAR